MNSVTVASMDMLDLKPRPAASLNDYLEGLRRSPKTLPWRLFFDREGTELFARMSQLPDYYLRRAEAAAIQKAIPDLVQLVGPSCLLAELGEGDDVNTRLLLSNLDHPAAYIPVDATRRSLSGLAARLAQSFPHVQILPISADYTRPFQLPSPMLPPRRTVFFLPGATMGHLAPREAEKFLRNLIPLAGPEGAVVVAVDHKKNIDVLEGAYNDSRGITAAFHKNILARANRELQGSFNLSRFEHLAFYNETDGCIEMHLVSLDQQPVHLMGEAVWFDAGESILTDSAYKYFPEEFMQLTRRAGWTPSALWHDAQNYVSLHYLTVD